MHMKKSKLYKDASTDSLKPCDKCGLMDPFYERRARKNESNK